MSVLGTFIKQPAEKESYSIDYSEDLTEGDGIASAVVEIAPEGLTLEFSVVTSPRVKAVLSGGTVGMKYKITVTAETDDGRILQDEYYIKIKDY